VCVLDVKAAGHPRNKREMSHYWNSQEMSLSMLVLRGAGGAAYLRLPFVMGFLKGISVKPSTAVDSSSGT
jgi:hypothetical protein